MSFLEFLIEYYIYIVLVLILLIVTVIGFIVDSKNKEKAKKGNVTLNDLSDDLSLTEDSSNSGVLATEVNSSNLNQSVTNFNQLHASAITNSNEPVSSFNNQSTQQNVAVVSNALNNTVNNNLNDSIVNDASNLVSAVNSASELSNQIYNGQVMSNDVSLNNVSSLDSGIDNGNKSILIQPQENIQPQVEINSSISTQPQANMQPQVSMQPQAVANQSSVNNGYMSDNINSGIVNNEIVSNVNSLQYDMANPMSLENVNSSQVFNMPNGYNSQYQGYAVSQNPQVMNVNYNNGYNYMANNSNAYPTGQVVNNNFNGMNNSYQSNMVNTTMNSSLNPNIQPNVGVNNNVVVTTDGAKPFDINSMFVNNQ